MKKNKIILIVAIVIVSLLIILLGVGAYLYFTTDFLKSNQQLFFKYLAKNDTILEEFMQNDDQEVLNNIKKDKHVVDTEITLNLESNNTEIANELVPVRNFSIKSTAKSDPVNKKDSRETILKHLNEEIFKLKYLRNGDKYALTSDEVVNKYITFENNNLKELASKYGISDTSIIPNKIGEFNFEEYFYIDGELEKKINDKYSKLVLNQIPNNNYSKQKNVNISVNNQILTVNAYSLTLTEKQVMDIYISILEEFKEDETVLNLIFEKSNYIYEQSVADIEEVKDVIQNMIDSLNNIQVDEAENMIITVYEKDGELVRTELAFSQNSITFDPQNSSTQVGLIIKFNMQDNNELEINKLDLKQIEIMKERANDGNTLTVAATLTAYDASTIKVSVQGKVNVGDNVEEDVNINVNIANIMYLSAKVNTKTTPDSSVEIEDLTQDNSVIINDYTPENMASLMEQIGSRLQSLFETKVNQIITTYQNPVVTPPESNNGNNGIGKNAQNSNSNTISNIISNTI